MYDFVRCNKLPGVYWLKGPVEDITIKIKLKPPDDILSLPKFEDFINETRNINIETSIEEYTFKWQEKAFSAWEIQRYTDVHNCITEAELDYNQILESNEIKSNKVFTYIHDDYYLPLPYESKKQSSKLESCLEKLSLNSAVDSMEERFGGKTMSVQKLFSKSEEYVYEDGKSEEYVYEDDKWSAMHVVLDNSDYNEEEKLILKKESTLLSIYHNIPQNFIILSPDTNTLELNPYTVDDVRYEVLVDVGGRGNTPHLDVTLNKLNKKWEKKQRSLVKFIVPPLGKIQYYVSVELVSATGFNMDNIYIEYDLKLPEGTECDDTLHGRTHTSQFVTIDNEEVWHFGHIIELNITANAGCEPAPIQMTLEIISTDWWMRHRTEGYTTVAIRLQAGAQSMALTSLTPGYTCSDKQMRLFVGGCHLLNSTDIMDPSIVQTGSGSVIFRSNIVSQSSRAGVVHVGPQHTSATALLMGAETALRKYKKARAKLAAATKNIAELGFGDGKNVDTIKSYSH